jgi:hypothetical protein
LGHGLPGRRSKRSVLRDRFAGIPGYPLGKIKKKDLTECAWDDPLRALYGPGFRVLIAFDRPNILTFFLALEKEGLVEYQAPEKRWDGITENRNQEKDSCDY